jgi:O-acetyl-ADP-ribose deacetylase (regulator of RNase III)
MKIHFVSLQAEWIEEIKKLFPESNCTFTCGNVEKISQNYTAFVSPANCLGFMDGGIDYVYSRNMFPGCERTVRGKIIDLGFKTLLGRPYLPIGSSFCIEVDLHTGLICAPTMFLPHDVSATRNAYLSFLAALLVFQKIGKYKTLVVTSHCCGYGKMLASESAKQMRHAYDDFCQKKYPTDRSVQADVVLMPNYDTEQPNNYDNREIKDIPFDQMFKNYRK